MHDHGVVCGQQMVMFGQKPETVLHSTLAAVNFYCEQQQVGC